MKWKVSLKIWVEQMPEFETAKEAYEYGKACGINDKDIAVFEVKNEKNE